MSDKLKCEHIKNEEEFFNFMKHIKGDLYRIAKARLLQDEDIYDAIQETTIISYQYIKKKKNIDNFKTWIIRVLINECNHIYKRQKKQVDLIKKGNLYSLESYTLIEDIDSKISFDKILSSLKYKERLIIHLYYGSRFTTKEIADILRINENTVKTKIFRVKKQIQKEIEGGNN